MAKTLGEDYVIVRAFGSLGDKGCDGFRASTGTMYACYGKLEDAGLVVPDVSFAQGGGRLGRHSEQFGQLIGELQVLARAHPGATW